MIASIILGLYLFGIMDAESAATFLYVTGGLLIAAEFFLIGGIFAFNGAIALLVGYAIASGSNALFGVPLDWGLFFGIAFVEVAILIAAIFLIIRYRRHGVSTGTESMVGQKASVVEWKGQKGRVQIQGETWKAESDKEMDLKKDEKVTVDSVDNLTLKIKV
ncbi:MAG: hypothetical protein DHS20C02_02990 [Micavibrio sp.]|nr:MAG: hypothetical protein DHS20C02_02990 [Micavibrio sp.]